MRDASRLLVDPLVEVGSIERHSAILPRQLRQLRPYGAVERILVHAEICRCVLQPDDLRGVRGRGLRGSVARLLSVKQPATSEFGKPVKLPGLPRGSVHLEILAECPGKDGENVEVGGQGARIVGVVWVPINSRGERRPHTTVVVCVSELGERLRHLVEVQHRRTHTVEPAKKASPQRVAPLKRDPFEDLPEGYPLRGFQFSIVHGRIAARDRSVLNYVSGGETGGENFGEHRCSGSYNTRLALSSGPTRVPLFSPSPSRSVFRLDLEFARPLRPAYRRSAEHLTGTHLQFDLSA